MKKFRIALGMTVMLGIAAFSYYMNVAPQLYMTKTGEVSFFSKAPIEDIDAHNKSVAIALDTVTNEIACVLMIDQFQFRKQKMQRDFNENYMESQKLPQATFTGKINEKINYRKEGTNRVSVTGKLKIHGAEQVRTEKGTLTIKDNKVMIRSSFKIRVKEFNVKIPVLLIKNIAEVVDVTVSADLLPADKVMTVTMK